MINSSDTKWNFNTYKQVKIIKTSNRISFQRKGNYTRGLTISKDAFHNMDDVTITSGRRIQLEPEVWLINHGKEITLVKYCMTHDKKRCEGGYFVFTLKEWNYFWTIIRQHILQYFDR